MPSDSAEVKVSVVQEMVVSLIFVMSQIVPSANTTEAFVLEFRYGGRFSPSMTRFVPP